MSLHSTAQDHPFLSLTVKPALSLLTLKQNPGAKNARVSALEAAAALLLEQPEDLLT